MMHRLVEVIFPVPAPTDHTAMMEDPREEEDLVDVAEVVLPTAVVMMLVVTRHMIKRLPRESRITTLVQVKTIIRPYLMELPLSTHPEITVKATMVMKVRLTTEFEHFEAISHERANIFFLSLPWALDFHASSGNIQRRPSSVARARGPAMVAFIVHLMSIKILSSLSASQSGSTFQ